MPQWGGGQPIDPVTFQRAMVFVDGTNLFYRLACAKLRWTGAVPLSNVFRSMLRGRQVVRRYLYTTEQTLAIGRATHGDAVAAGFRIVLGDGIPTADGNIREKGVDALLVADLVYHAAAKNYDYALLVTTDTDFVHGLRRVEDFGCRTGVLGVCCDVPLRLSETADDAFVLPEEKLLTSGLAQKLP